MSGAAAGAPAPARRRARSRPTQRLDDLVRATPWMLRVLRAARSADLPQCWVGGGVLRDLVWDSAVGRFDPARVRDVDVAFFDAADLSPHRDRRADLALRAVEPDVPWEATNQAAVHTWYAAAFGDEVPPLRSTLDGVRTWPETATSVAVRLDDADRLHVTGVAGGLPDLLGLVHRRNPRRVSVEEYRRRLARRDFVDRWPHVQVVPE
ncbi:nucleotidyltransferase family protein [Cellulosimicrobium cellulans]|uniref:nucleotidyltransferase family protein n=1 Tax=Cellulosimicrobium cellulans TaxID=1710 RepID=UPI001C9E7135|nr:nucleotidyltransferase family protein [Cellulosimicrobium cellulans]